jgi:hypothetical protein
MTSLNDLRADARLRIARAKNKRALSDRRIRQGLDVGRRAAVAAMKAANSILSPRPSFNGPHHGRALIPERGQSFEELVAIVEAERQETERQAAEFSARVSEFVPPTPPERPWLSVQDDIDALSARLASETNQRYRDELEARIEQLQKIEDVLRIRREDTAPRDWLIAYVEAYAAFWGELVGKPQDLSHWRPVWLPSKTEVREVYRAKAQ